MKSIRSIKLAAVALAIFLTTTLFAQGPPAGGDNKGDKIDAFIVGYLTQRLNLTPAEAQKFWPIYNQYRDELKALRKSFKDPSGETPTADESIAFEQKKLDLKKKYKAQFEAAIGTAKVNTLYQAEEEIKQKLKELREKRQENRGQGNPPAGSGKFGGR